MKTIVRSLYLLSSFFVRIHLTDNYYFFRSVRQSLCGDQKWEPGRQIRSDDQGSSAGTHRTASETMASHRFDGCVLYAKVVASR